MPTRRGWSSFERTWALRSEPLPRVEKCHALPEPNGALRTLRASRQGVSSAAVDLTTGRIRDRPSQIREAHAAADGGWSIPGRRDRIGATASAARPEPISRDFGEVLRLRDAPDRATVERRGAAHRARFPSVGIAVRRMTLR